MAHVSSNFYKIFTSKYPVGDIPKLLEECQNETQILDLLAHTQIYIPEIFPYSYICFFPSNLIPLLRVKRTYKLEMFFSLQSSLGEFASKFGLTAKQFGENIDVNFKV